MAEETPSVRSDNWLGWMYFAGLLLMLSGIFHIIAGFVALFKDEIYLVGPRTLLVLTTYQGWGWAHLGIGVVLVFASLGLFRSTASGRTIGVLLAAVSAIASFAFLGAYPLWALLIIAIDLCVIYAIVVHGSRAKPIHAATALPVEPTKQSKKRKRSPPMKDL